MRGGKLAKYWKAVKKLENFFDTHQRYPSYQEMAKLFGYKSKSGSYYMAKKLLEFHLVRKDATGKLLLKREKQSFSVPILGAILAGHPALKVAVIEGEKNRYLSLSDLFRNGIYNSVLQMRGDSMVDAGIHEGDFVIINGELEPRNGDIVVALVDDIKWEIKYFRKNGDEIALIPANKNYTPIYPKNNLKIRGVVTNVIRSYR